jgi:hypothetical protein
MPRLLHAAMLIVLAAVPAAGGQSGPSPAETKTLNLTAYSELLRADIRAQKVAIIAEVMGFSETEDKAFWPIYRDYDAQMTRLGDERVALVAEYARVIDQMTDEAADTLARKAIDLEHKRQEAKAKLYDRVKSALNGRAALRFLQVEHQLQLLIDLQIAAALPISAR